MHSFALAYGDSNKGYAPHSFIQSLVLMLHGGGKALEDIRMIEADRAMRELLYMEEVPTAGAIGKWLKRLGLAGVYGMERIGQVLLRRYLRRVGDASVSFPKSRTVRKSTFSVQ